jgi:hypothetical protein
MQATSKPSGMAEDNTPIVPHDLVDTARRPEPHDDIARFSA